MKFDTIPNIGYEVRQSVITIQINVKAHKRGGALALFRRFALSLRLLGAPRITPANHLCWIRYVCSTKATQIADLPTTPRTIAPPPAAHCRGIPARRRPLEL